MTVALMPREIAWTVDDLDLLPDDGLQYELLDGVLLVSPAPIPRHQWVVGSIYIVLRQACVSGQQVYVSPIDWRPDRGTSLQPDVLVVMGNHLDEPNITTPLLLAVEVLSPSTRRKDQVFKRSKYEDSGVKSYWIVDPVEPSIEVLQLVDGAYRRVAMVSGEDDVDVELPFRIRLQPAALLRA